MFDKVLNPLLYDYVETVIINSRFSSELSYIKSNNSTRKI